MKNILLTIVLFLSMVTNQNFASQNDYIMYLASKQTDDLLHTKTQEAITFHETSIVTKDRDDISFSLYTFSDGSQLLSVDYQGVKRGFVLSDYVEGPVDAVLGESFHNAYAFAFVQKRENESHIYTFRLDEEGLSKHAMDIWYLDDPTITLIDDHHMSLKSDDSTDIYDGPQGVLLRIDHGGRHVYSLISNFEQKRNAKSSIEQSIYFSDALSESFLRKDYHMSKQSIMKETKTPQFDDSVIAIVYRNRQMLNKSYWRIPLPRDYIINDLATGDLNGDQLDDYCITLEHIPGFSSTDRRIYVFMSKGKDAFDIQKCNDHLAFGSIEGGVWGDPYLGASIKDGALTIMNYGGSSDRWEYSFTFTYMDDALFLTSSREETYSTLTGSGIVYAYDYLENLVTIKSKAFEEKANNLVLHTYPLKDSRLQAFSDVNPYQVTSDYDPPIDRAYLPALYRFPFGEVYWGGEMKKSPVEVLLALKEKVYPDMERILFSYSEDTMKVYDILVNAEVPRFYYQKGDYVLSFDQIQSWTDQEVIYHFDYRKVSGDYDYQSIRVSVNDDGSIRILTKD